MLLGLPRHRYAQLGTSTRSRQLFQGFFSWAAAVTSTNLQGTQGPGALLAPPSRRGWKPAGARAADNRGCRGCSAASCEERAARNAQLLLGKHGLGGSGAKRGRTRCTGQALSRRDLVAELSPSPSPWALGRRGQMASPAAEPRAGNRKLKPEPASSRCISSIM